MRETPVIHDMAGKLTLQGVSVTYPDGTLAVEGLDLTVREGESVALIGANGAGKTTLLLSLVGVIPARGRILVDGITLDGKSLDSVRQRVGLVFQNPDDQLFMHDIFDDVAFGLRNAGVAEAEVALRVDHALNGLRIGHLRERSVLRLSGGEKRLAALATVMVMAPSLMLFDEPTVYLDPKARRNLIGVMNNISTTKVIATHDLAFAAETCTRVVALKDGKVYADGRPDELLYDVARMDACGVEAIGA
jgi:cobalt/nickel transport system ATP-binding protein